MPIYYVKIANHITVPYFEEMLRPAARGSEPRFMIIDTLAMTGYDSEVRTWFSGTWTKQHPIHCLAGISDKFIWRVVGSAVGLAARVPTRIFGTVAEAQAWCDDLEAAHKRSR